MSAPAEHWQHVYTTRDINTVSWTEAAPSTLPMLLQDGLVSDQRVLDVGGGRSILHGAILKHTPHLSVLDISSAALEQSRAQLGGDANRVQWIVGDVLTSVLPQVDIWHDRAVFHFLTDPDDRAQYAWQLLKALAPGGRAVIATFAEDGPQVCSTLPVQRYSPLALAAALGPELVALNTWRIKHPTPRGPIQPFSVALFQRSADQET